MNIFIYGDWLQTKLLGVCKVIIMSVISIDIQVTAKQELEHTLNVQNIPNAAGTGIQRVVEVLASDPQTIHPPAGNLRNL